MNLAVDARWMVGQYRGMGRYAHSLLAPVRHKVLAFLPKKLMPEDYETVSFGHSFFPYWEQVILPRLCKKYQIEDLLCPYNSAPLFLPADTHLTLVIHDLIYLEPWQHLPPSVSLYQTLGRLYRRWVVPKAIRRASHLVTVSEYTRSKVLRCFGIPTERVTVIPNSLPDNWYVRKPRPIAERGSYILSVTGEAPSKNLPALLRAFALVCESLKGHEAMPQLLIIGISPSQHSHFQKMASRIGVIGAVNFTSYIPEAELQRLYREATLFVMPSLYEGFGIPVLEAMASGTAVASSNATSLPEVVGNAGWLFDPRDVEDMAHTLCTAWKSPSGRYEYALRGLEQAQRFRRSTIARQIADFWEDKK